MQIEVLTIVLDKEEDSKKNTRRLRKIGFFVVITLVVFVFSPKVWAGEKAQCCCLKGCGLDCI